MEYFPTAVVIPPPSPPRDSLFAQWSDLAGEVIGNQGKEFSGLGKITRTGSECDFRVEIANVRGGVAGSRVVMNICTQDTQEGRQIRHLTATSPETLDKNSSIKVDGYPDVCIGGLRIQTERFALSGLGELFQCYPVFGYNYDGNGDIDGIDVHVYGTRENNFPKILTVPGANLLEVCSRADGSGGYSTTTSREGVLTRLIEDFEKPEEERAKLLQRLQATLRVERAADTDAGLLTAEMDFILTPENRDADPSRQEARGTVTLFPKGIPVKTTPEGVLEIVHSAIERFLQAA